MDWWFDCLRNTISHQDAGSTTVDWVSLLWGCLNWIFMIWWPVLATRPKCSAPPSLTFSLFSPPQSWSCKNHSLSCLMSRNQEEFLLWLHLLNYSKLGRWSKIKMMQRSICCFVSILCSSEETTVPLVQFVLPATWEPPLSIYLFVTSRAGRQDKLYARNSQYKLYRQVSWPRWAYATLWMPIPWWLYRFPIDWGSMPVSSWNTTALRSW